MERTHFENGRRSTSKESTRRNPCRKEKPRSTVEKMERRTGLNKPPAYMKRKRRRRRRRRRSSIPLPYVCDTTFKACHFYRVQILQLNARHLTSLGALKKLRKATTSFVMPARPSVRPSTQNNSAPTGRIFMKLDILLFFENVSRKFNFDQNLHEKQALYGQTDVHLRQLSCRVLRIRNVTEESCRVYQNMLFVFNNLLPKIVSFIRKRKKKIRRNHTSHMKI